MVERRIAFTALDATNILRYVKDIIEKQEKLELEEILRNLQKTLMQLDKQNTAETVNSIIP